MTESNSNDSDGSGGVIVGNDEQLGMDLDLDVEESAWAKWVDPQRHAAQARKFLQRAELPALPPEPWDFESDEASQINDVVAELFPDIEAMYLPDNADLVDQLVCFTGEWFVKYLDAQWIDIAKYKDMPSGYNDCGDKHFYPGIEPGIAFKFEGWKTCSAEFLTEYIIENEFISIIELVSVSFWRLRKEGAPSFSEARQDFPYHPPFM
ncbi:hypothetical protein [Nocardia terpenica]|uniref:hypothetical protein n=1 Tax=Nocardia terpenica TaxID=455432 RepID=UPI001E335BB3|nr:hypothetical protein [Nocardia terpenica]